MITTQNIWLQWTDLADNDIFNVQDAGAPVNGGSGTGVDICGPGSLYLNRTTGDIYVNKGSIASPLWVMLNVSVARAFGNGPVGYAKAMYDYAVDGGATGAIT